jgi:hypothetical protein
MTTQKWSLCRLCMRAHYTTEHNGKFVRVLNGDDTHVWHRR